MPAPSTSSPLCAWLTYTCTWVDITTHGCPGSGSSETSACSGWLWIGSRIPASEASTEECPADASATAPARIGPRLVPTPATPSPGRSNPGAPAARQECRPEPVRAAGVSPRDVVVLGDPAARLQRRAEHRVAHVRRGVDDRAELRDLLGRQPLGVDPVEPVGVDPAGALADVAEGVREVEHAALAEQDVVVQ